MSARFDKLTEIGRDAFILRYDATQRDGTRADVRLLAPVLAAQIRHAPRFFATMERASQVRHPGLSPVIAWGGGGNEVFVAYARTGELLAAGTRRSAEIAVVGASLARALETAHAAGLTHGAICPAEVRLDHGRAVLSGLGLYQALCDGGVEPAQAANVAQPAYLSPEQQRGETASERSDVYALGAVLYEMLTGKPPFGGRTTSYVMATVLSGDEPGPVTPESSVVQEATPEVDALLRAIERAPEDRWPTMAAFADALEAGSTGIPRRSGGQARRGGLGGLLARIWRRR